MGKHFHFIILVSLFASNARAQYSSANQDTEQNTRRYETQDNGFITDDHIDDDDRFNNDINNLNEPEKQEQQAVDTYNPNENGFVNQQTRGILDLLEDEPIEEEPVTINHEGRYL